MKQNLLIIAVLVLLIASLSHAQQFPPVINLGPFPTGSEEVRGDSPWDAYQESDIVHEYTCYMGTPVIDGDIDNDEVWQKIPYTVMDWYQNNGPTGEEYSIFDDASDAWYGPEDCTAWFKMLWDGDYIYLAIKVVDDDYYSGVLPVWQDDCIQFGFHTRPPGEEEDGTGAAVNLALIDDMVHYHRPLSATHGFAWSELRLADGDNSTIYFVNDDVEEYDKAIFCSVDSTNADSIVIIWEFALDLFSGEVGDYVAAGEVHRLSLLNIDRDRYDDLISQAVTWGAGILKGKDMNQFTSVLFSSDAPPAASVASSGSALPNNIELLQNYPNPFNSTTRLSFSLPHAAAVNVAVYNVNGVLVSTLIENETRAAGQHSVLFDASHLSNGIYFYQLAVDGATALQRKMSYIK